uniref:Uncharacterized protein n=1 Tax=Nelumbo nucifera TaxID=4432 RepID=A0A822XUH3_NELNU|nr:TPA_asm: hypothetical protein HUJ06_024284 [Nelumbo nucifera]
MHFVLSSTPASFVSAFISASKNLSVSGSFEFEFSARFPSNTSTTRPQILAPLLDLESRETEFEKCEESLTRGRDLRLRSGSLHKRARSLSPLRNTPFQWHEEEEYQEVRHAGELHPLDLEDSENKQAKTPSTGTTPSISTSSSRSSSSRRSSKRWSSVSFSPAKEKKSSSTSLLLSSSKEKKSSTTPTTVEAQKPKRSQQVSAKKTLVGKPTNGIGKSRIPPSPHELHYMANRAQAEEMRKLLGVSCFCHLGD